MKLIGLQVLLFLISFGGFQSVWPAPKNSYLHKNADEIAYLNNPYNPEINAFSTDGCSMSPDGVADNPQAWLHCCLDHDVAYWRGGNVDMRLEADQKLWACIANEGYPVIADIYFWFVRRFGKPNTGLSYRWGYGWNYGIGYNELTADQLRSVDEKLGMYFRNDRRD